MMSTSSDQKTTRNKPNYLYSIVSVALVLFLIGLFGLVLLHAQRLMRLFKEQITITVELKDSTLANDIANLEQALVQSPFVKDGRVQFVSREEAAQLMQEDFGEDFLKLGLPNPFYDVFTFNVKADYLQKDSLEFLKSKILAQYSVVSDVYYQENVIEQVGHNIQRIRYLTLALSVALLLIATALIYNTVRLALYANRFLIKNMELVGASWEFISRPYLIRGMMHGLFSGLLAVAALAAMLFIVQRQLPDLRELNNPAGFATLFAGLIVLGMLMNVISTYLVVTKYLKMRVDDLYY